MTTFVLQGARAAVPYLINTAGQVALSYANAAISNALNPRTIEGPRLETLHIQTSRDGAPMPRVFGRTRLAGQVIWASNFKETTTTQRAGGGKGAGPKVKNYSYTISFAIGLCEGEISSVERLWANGENLKKSDINCRIYTGSEIQNPDPIIAAIDGANAPAFRGTAYIVFEDFPLDDYGARLPQINAEILRAPARIDNSPRLEDLIEGVDLIPGSGEFVYATQAIEDTSIPGQSRTININNLSGQADIALALDQLQASLPNCKSVNIVASWFGDDLRCGQCKLRPGVETKDRRSKPDDWRVGSETRSSAYLISRRDDKPVYGGTPSDKTLIDLIKELKSRGLKASFYPFILMDINPDKGQPDFPWRGRISCDFPRDDKTNIAAAQVNDFFGAASPNDFAARQNSVIYSGPNEHSFRRMILHYANLCKLAGGVDTFVIGSEMRGLTTVRGPGLSYPAVEHFKTLAADVRLIVGPATGLTYAADWSEYFGHHKDGNTIFHLDPLWSDSNIDAVGIDAYFPLSDVRQGDDTDSHNMDCLSANIEGGEGYDYYYKSEADRTANIQTPITDGTYQKPWVYRFKDLKNWWSRPHYNRISGTEDTHPTAWQAQSKPIWLTEIGCPAVDKGANQPNVFYDPKSSESFLPYFSNGQRDDLVQRRYLEAMISYWQPAAGHNPVSDIYGGPMIDPGKIHVWSWDARPYPDFPVRGDVWSDGPNWARGHWLSGRVGAALLADIVHEIASRGGDANIDVSGLTGLVSGYTLDRPMSPRAALEPLAQAYGFTCIETPAGLRFQMPGSGAGRSLGLNDISANDAQAPLRIKHIDKAQMPQDVRLYFIDIGDDYQRGVASALDLGAARDFVTDITAPLVLDRGTAKAMSARLLARALIADRVLTFDIMPGADDLRAGDIIELPPASGTFGPYVIDGLDGLTTRTVTASPLYDAGYTALKSAVPHALPAISIAPVPQIIVLDIPHMTARENRAGPLIAAYSAPWSAVTISHGTQTIDLETPTYIATLLADLPAGPISRFHAAGRIHIFAPGAQLVSASRNDMLNGANALALKTAGGWEIIQYQHAQLIAPNEYILTGLLRGQAGSDALMQDRVAAGAQIVLLGNGLGVLPVDSDLRGSEITLLASARSRNDSQAVTADYNAVQLIPLAPVHPRIRREPAGGAVLSWTRRTRLGGDDWAARDVPLAQDEARYEIELLRGGEVIANYETTSASLTLPATALAGPQERLDVRIYQISRITGRGYPLETHIKI